MTLPATVPDSASASASAARPNGNVAAICRGERAVGEQGEHRGQIRAQPPGTASGAP
jgi:hypothetical protein